MLSPNAALLELRAIVSTYLDGSDDAARATELLDVLGGPTTVRVEPQSPPSSAQEARERAMFGCREASIDVTIDGMEQRDVAMYAMGCLSNAQELIQRSECDGKIEWTVHHAHHANTIRQLINIAKYAIDKAVPR